MRVDLANRRACVIGTPHPLLDAVAAALEGNGATAVTWTAEAVPDIAVLARDLRPEPTAAGDGDEAANLDRLGDAMARHGSGRVVLLLSAVAAVPSRRCPQLSIAAAAALAHLRTLAMRLGPAVLINAVGCGAVADAGGGLISGDASMLSHVPSGQPGSIEDVVNAVLFLCDPLNSYMTGQTLTVDGGWSAGYGRNF